MKEIERKIFDIDPVEVGKKLEELGAEKTYDGLLTICYLDTEDGKVRAAGNLLRVRKFTDTDIEICFKTNKRIEEDCKVYDEFTLKGNNYNDVLELLKKMSYKATCRYEKKRTIYKLLDAEVVIDQYPKIDPFMEIEAGNSGIIESWIEKLGLSENESSSETINEVLKRKYPEVELDNLTF